MCVSQALDTIEEALTAAHGTGSFERVDGGTPSMQRHAVVRRFGQPDASSW